MKNNGHASINNIVMLAAFTLLVAGCAAADSSTDVTSQYGPGKGRLSVWTSASNVGNISVLVDGVPAGALAFYFNATPNCGQQGTTAIDLPVGSHALRAVASNGTTWNSNVDISEGKCLLFELRSGGLTSGGSSCGSLNGNWRRTGSSLDGLTVSFNGSAGTVTTGKTPFTAGDVKWRNFDSSACQVDDLIKGTDGSNPRYARASITFQTSSRIIVHGEANDAQYDRF